MNEINKHVYKERCHHRHTIHLTTYWKHSYKARITSSRIYFPWKLPTHTHTTKKKFTKFCIPQTSNTTSGLQRRQTGARTDGCMKGQKTADGLTIPHQAGYPRNYYLTLSKSGYYQAASVLVSSGFLGTEVHHMHTFYTSYCITDLTNCHMPFLTNTNGPNDASFRSFGLIAGFKLRLGLTSVDLRWNGHTVHKHQLNPPLYPELKSASPRGKNR